MPGTRPDAPARRFPLPVLALLVFAVALALYRAGMAPGLLWGDSAEMQILAGIGGVAHPTGYPLFILVAQAVTRLTGLAPDFAANLISGVFAAGTLALLVTFLVRRGVSAVAATGAVIAWGLSFTFWSTAQRAEVYSLATFVAVGALWCTLLAIEHWRPVMRLAAGLLLGLTLTGHMAFGPLVAVAGLVLAWRVPRNGARWFADEVLLLTAFLVGLSPYLYLEWADAHAHGLSYLRLVEIAQWPLGDVPVTFLEPLERFRWLLLGQNVYPPVHVAPTLRGLAKNLSDITFLFGAFEFGAIGCVLAWLGARAGWETQRRETTMLLTQFAVSVLFTLILSWGKIIAIFLIPAFLVFTWFVAHGLDGLVLWLNARPRARGLSLLLLLLPLVGAVTSHALRVEAYAHPFGPLRSRVLEEDDLPQHRLVPTMADQTEARAFVESAARTIPDSSLVIAEWREFMALLYLQRVEGRRTDLTVHPVGYPKLLLKVAEWQTHRDLTRHPIVAVSSLETLRPHLGAVDTLRFATGQRGIVTHVPLDTTRVR
ncbi:MAG: hypothetical protein RL760_790 [Candidatus Eisenbacteria bacterium]